MTIAVWPKEFGKWFPEVKAEHARLWISPVPDHLGLAGDLTGRP